MDFPQEDLDHNVFMGAGIVTGVWLQTGSDIKKLEVGLRHLRNLTEASPIPVYGSFFLPSKK